MEKFDDWKDTRKEHDMEVFGVSARTLYQI
jgi:hypothetical protein